MGLNFESFWTEYPRKVGKLGAQKAYTKALKSSSHEDIMSGLARALPTWATTEIKYIPHPQTWLNQGRWMDEAGPPDSDKPRSLKTDYEFLWRLRLKDYKPGGFWISTWGCRPEHGGTDIPQHILAEWERRT